MADSTARELEQLLEDLVRRAVEGSLESFRQQIRDEVREAVAQSGVAGRPTEPAMRAEAAMQSPAPAAPPPSLLPMVSQGVSRVLQPTGQSDIMAALLESAASFGGRCALFVKRGDSFTFWRAEGFPVNEAAQLRSVSASARQPGAFKEICDSLLPVSTSRSAGAFPEGMLAALGSPGEDSLYVFPLIAQGRVVAALYADSGEAGASVEASALEIIARVAGLSLETAAGRAAAGSARPAAVSAVPATPAPSAPAPPRTVEAVAPPPAPSGPIAPVIPPPPDPETLPEPDRDAHRKAYRFARVAVQDLMTYHKSKIEDAREKKSLYAVLKDDIDKTRENYQKRFGQSPAQSFDYLHYEMVTKLAANDPAALGSDYPGPVTG